MYSLCHVGQPGRGHVKPGHVGKIIYFLLGRPCTVSAHTVLVKSGHVGQVILGRSGHMGQAKSCGPDYAGQIR